MFIGALFLIDETRNNPNVHQLVKREAMWGIFSNKKEQITDKPYNMDEPQKHYSKWKKPGADMKDQILNDSVCMNFPERANRDRKQISGCLGSECYWELTETRNIWSDGIF